MTSGGTILYVDDDAALARLVQRALTRRGHQVVLAADAEQGLAAVAAGGIDVVALDHTTFSFGTPSVSKKVRKNGPVEYMFITRGRPMRTFERSAWERWKPRLNARRAMRRNGSFLTSTSLLELPAGGSGAGS